MSPFETLRGSAHIPTTRSKRARVWDPNESTSFIHDDAQTKKQQVRVVTVRRSACLGNSAVPKGAGNARFEHCKSVVVDERETEKPGRSRKRVKRRERTDETNCSTESTTVFVRVHNYAFQLSRNPLWIVAYPIKKYPFRTLRRQHRQQ